MTFYFSLSFVFLGIIRLQTLLLTFSFIETPFLNQLQTFAFSLIVLIAEIIGFCLNSKHKEFTSEELDFLLHVVLVITNKRLLVCGETISGRIFTRYDTDCWMLNEIKSIHLEKQNLDIKTFKDKLILKGENFDRLISKLEKYAP